MDLISNYANGLSELTNFSRNPDTAPLIVDVIVNPHAGFFKSKSTLEKIILDLDGDWRSCARGFPGARWR